MKSSFSEQGARSGIPTFLGSSRLQGRTPSSRVPGLLLARRRNRCWGGFLAVLICFLSSLAPVHATLTILSYHGMAGPAAPAVSLASNSSYAFNPAQVRALDRSLRFETVSGSRSSIAFRRSAMTLIPVPEGDSLFPLIGIVSLALVGHHFMRSRESFRACLRNIFRRQGSSL